MSSPAPRGRCPGTGRRGLCDVAGPPRPYGTLPPQAGGRYRLPLVIVTKAGMRRVRLRSNPLFPGAGRGPEPSSAAFHDPWVPSFAGKEQGVVVEKRGFDVLPCSAGEVPLKGAEGALQRRKAPLVPMGHSPRERGEITVAPRHPHEGGDPGMEGRCVSWLWVPACAGMTRVRLPSKPSLPRP